MLRPHGGRGQAPWSGGCRRPGDYSCNGALSSIWVNHSCGLEREALLGKESKGGKAALLAAYPSQGLATCWVAFLERRTSDILGEELLELMHAVLSRVSAECFGECVYLVLCEGVLGKRPRKVCQQVDNILTRTASDPEKLETRVEELLAQGLAAAEGMKRNEIDLEMSLEESFLILSSTVDELYTGSPVDSRDRALCSILIRLLGLCFSAASRIPGFTISKIQARLASLQCLKLREGDAHTKFLGHIVQPPTIVI